VGPLRVNSAQLLPEPLLRRRVLSVGGPRRGQPRQPQQGCPRQPLLERRVSCGVGVWRRGL